MVMPLMQDLLQNLPDLWLLNGREQTFEVIGERINTSRKTIWEAVANKEG